MLFYPMSLILHQAQYAVVSLSGCLLVKLLRENNMKPSLPSDSGLVESHFNPFPKTEKTLHIDATANVTITEIKVGSSNTFPRSLMERTESNEREFEFSNTALAK